MLTPRIAYTHHGAVGEGLGLQGARIKSPGGGGTAGHHARVARRRWSPRTGRAVEEEDGWAPRTGRRRCGGDAEEAPRAGHAVGEDAVGREQPLGGACGGATSHHAEEEEEP